MLADIQAGRRQIDAALLASVSQWLRAAMVAKELSQLHVAIAADVSPTTILRILQGRDARLTTVAHVAASLGHRMEISFKPCDDESPL